jgi:ABC-type branched-subunit amino acid transport system substrate-binding protein
VFIIQGALFIVQQNLEHRYDSAWQYAKGLEKALAIKNGLQKRLEDTKFPVVSFRKMVVIFWVLLYTGSVGLAIVNSVQLSHASNINVEMGCQNEINAEH